MGHLVGRFLIRQRSFFNEINSLGNLNDHSSQALIYPNNETPKICQLNYTYRSLREVFLPMN